jgi:hypothetical protein
MIWSDASAAPATPPLTGESATCTPCVLKTVYRLRISVGELVERST